MAQQKISKREKFAATAQARQAEKEVMSMYNVPAWWALIPFLIAVLVYVNTLGFGFALDDYAAIIENTDTRKGISALPEIFSTSYRHGYIMISDELYRPLPKALFAICWQIAPDSPAPGHFLNVFLFGITCFLIYKAILRWWPRQPQLALLTACIYAVLPVHTEVVSNIKSLDEILALLFGILSLDLFYRYHQSDKKHLLFMSALSFFMAFLSKESSVTFLPIFPLLLWFAGNKSLKDSLFSSWFMLIPAFLFLIIRYKILHANGSYTPAPPSVSDNMLSYAQDPLLRLTSAVAMLGRYLQVMIAGYPLTFDMSYPQVAPEGFSSPVFLISAAVHVFMLIMAIKGWSQRREWSFALFFFFITVSVPSNIFMIIGTHYGERLMYLPSFGIAMLLAALALNWKVTAPATANRISRNLLLLMTPVLILWAGMSIARNPVWSDNGTLYFSGLSSAPNSVRVQYYQGLYLGKPETIASFPEGSRDSVIKAAFGHLTRATQLYPRFTDAWTQLGVISFREAKNVLAKGDSANAMKGIEEALLYYGKAQECNPYDPVVFNNRATVLFEIKRYQEAMDGFAQAIRLKPDYADALMNMGSCNGLMGRYNEALVYFDKAIAVDPGLAQAYYFAGITWQNLGNQTKANSYLQQFEMLKNRKKQ